MCTPQFEFYGANPKKCGGQIWREFNLFFINKKLTTSPKTSHVPLRDTPRHMPKTNKKLQGTNPKEVLVWDTQGNQSVRDIDSYSNVEAHVSQFPLGKSILVRMHPVLTCNL